MLVGIEDFDGLGEQLSNQGQFHQNTGEKKENGNHTENGESEEEH